MPVALRRLPAFVSALALSAALAGGAAAFPAVGAASDEHQHQHGAPAAAADQAPPLAYRHRTLANGLQVYSLQDRSQPVVAVQMWYNVGAKDDPQGRAGFAHLFEHVLSRVTRNIPRAQIAWMVEDMGGQRNASTSPDWTNYFETVPSNYLERTLWFHAERMDRLVVNEEVFNAERDIVKEELRQRVLADPYGRLFRFVLPRHSFSTLPYHRPSIGSIEELDDATLEDALAFHDAYYRPDNAVLIVSGDFDQAELDTLIDRHFAGIQRPDRPIPRFTAEEPERTAPREVEALAPNVPRPAVAFSYPAPPVNSSDGAALDILDAILTRGDSSRFRAAFFEQAALATSANTYDSRMEDGGFWAPYVILADGATPEQVRETLAREIARLREEPVSAAELEEARTELISAALYSRETAQGRAFALGNAVMEAGDPAFADRRLDELRRVTAEDVQRVARTWLDDSRRVSILYRDQGDGQEGFTPAPSVERYGLDLPPSTRPRLELAPEGERVAPPAPTELRAGQPPEIGVHQLSNGLRVVTVYREGLPLMSASLVVGAGSATEPAQLAGLADVSTAMTLKGAGDLSAQDIARRIEAAGGYLNAGSGADGAFLTGGAPTSRFPEILGIMAAAALEPVFPEEELARERRERTDALAIAMRQPGSIASRVLNRVVYGDAPYGSPASGTAETLAAISRDDVIEHHDRWWQPDNATLILSGDMEEAEALRLAEQAFSAWPVPAGYVPEISDPDGAAPAQPRVVVVDMPNAGQAAVYAAARAMPRDDQAYYPMQVASAVLGGGQQGRLFQEIRALRGLSYGAYSGLAAREGEGTLVASAQTRNDAVPQVAEIMLGQMTDLAGTLPDADMLERRKTFVVGNFVLSTQTGAGLAGQLAAAIAAGAPPEAVTDYPRLVGAVTPEQVAATAARVLNEETISLVIVGDARHFLEPLRARFPNVEVVPLSELNLMAADPVPAQAGAQ
ncbi:pitrilysin family protein [Brevundimonas sp. 2R-24]|uniref:Pitrilysin family protein n=1 Tax=Peiella sedimenti TaxID=3061083 RepID=A0ABT8SN75_9CAUL|nr:pitrilysin family protein [Caulobacteraceae bacterium XZ-24]